MKCPSCGASFPENTTTCEYCGSRMPKDSLVPGETASQERIFQRIKESTAFLKRNDPSRLAQIPQPDSMPMIVGGVFMVVWCSGALFMTVMFFLVAGPLALFPFGMLVIGVVAAAAGAGKFMNATSGPIHTVPAVVAGKRVAVSGGKNTSTSYYLTFEFEDGKRDEFPVYDGRIYGKVTEEDAGILYLRNRYAVDFERIRL